MSNQQTNDYPEPAYFYRLELATPDPENDKEMARMMIGIDGETPEILVWPRGASQKGKPPIRARLNTTALGEVISQQLVAAADGEPGHKGITPVHASRKTPDGKFERKVVSSIITAKRKDGVVVFGVYDADETRTRILFPFTKLDWLGTPTIGGEPISESELSRGMAKWYAKAFERICFDSMLKQTTAERKAFMDNIKARREKTSGGKGNHSYDDDMTL